VPSRPLPSHMTTTVHGKPGLPIIGALLTAALAFALAQTLVVPAIPAITEAFVTTTSSATWVLTGFLLSASVCTPLAGKLGDLFGKARVLTGLLVLFAIGSLVCAAAGSIEVLIGGRIVQGVAAGVFPLAFGIINDEFPPQRRAVAIGLMSAMFGIGGGLGLPLSGLIVDHVDVSWLFSVGVLALPAAFGVHRLVPASPARERTTVDWAGALLLSVGLVALLLGISKANAWGWDSTAVLACLAGGAAALVVFVRYELRTTDPLVDIRVLGERPVLAVNVAAFLTGVAMFGSFLLIPQFTQTPAGAGYGFGMSAVSAGLVMLPSSVAMLFAGPLAGALGNRIGFRAVLAIGTAFTIGSFLLLVVAHGSVADFLVSGALIGVGIAFSFAAMANIIVGSVDPGDVGIATGINTIMRTIGGAFGSALVTALLTAETLPGSPLPTEGAYTEAFAFSTAGAALALAAALAIPKVGGPRGGVPAPATA
jgi:EmrB/QacA subfamily drug resistance transporter